MTDTNQNMMIMVKLCAVALAGVMMHLSTGCRSVRGPQIDSLSVVQIGGVEQAVLARGANERLPVLLWLHGGPGAAHMPMAHKWNTDLEDTFIVVHWDQRGAGKSNPKDFDPSSMTLDQFVRDAREMTLHLKEKYRQDRIYLLGHSWGSKLGLLLARDDPESYHAFISVGQVVDPQKAQVVAHQWLSCSVQRRGRRKELGKLERLGLPPYEDHADFVEFMGMVDRHGGGMDVGFGRLLRSAWTSPYYRWRDYARWLNGARRGSGPMWEEYRDFSAFQQVPRLDIPVYFISGSHDMNTPVSLVREYFDALDAPHGKQMFVMDDTAHTPFWGKPGEFDRILKDIASEAGRRSR